MKADFASPGAISIAVVLTALAVAIDTGAVTVDGNLAFATGDVNASKNPTITAAGYTNSFAGTTSTQLYEIDAALDVLTLQNPPNNGTLTTIGNLGIDVDAPSRRQRPKFAN